MRGRCAGSDPRFARRLAARRARSAGAACFALGLAGGHDLLGLFQPEQQLIFRQRLGPAAEAVALQLLDDLAQPLVLVTLGDAASPSACRDRREDASCRDSTWRRVDHVRQRPRDAHDRG